MSRNDLSTRDVSDSAAGELEYVIAKDTKKEVEPTVSVEEAMAEKPVYKVTSTRNVTRVLFISNNQELLNPTKQTLDGYVNISDLFDEVHVVVLRTGIPPKNPVLRASENVWIYTASATHWWQLPKVGMQVVGDQLSFASGFRPDLIVARDPFESAIIARRAGKQFGRPTQLHIIEDFTSLEFLQKRKSNFFRRFLPYFTIKNFGSVRSKTEALTKKVQQRFGPADLKTLPRLQNYEALINKNTNVQLTDMYHGFSIFLLYVGPLTENCGLHKILDASKFILRNERVGLIVIGDGPAKDALQKQAKALEIEKQVIFEKETVDTFPYLKGAHLLFVTETTRQSEEVVLQAAAVGMPIVLTKTEQREDVFVDKYSAYFIDSKDTESITGAVSDLLNDVQGRQLMGQNAQGVIKEKFHFDPTEYQAAYRLSIEEALFTDENKPQ